MGILIGRLLIPTGGGGGGGLTLGPPTNSFNGATRAAAEAVRDAYAVANADWLAQYDAEATFTIILTWPVVPANTIYQSRRGNAWADVTGLVRGPRGVEGEQARFIVYSYINAAVAPVAAPVGGTFLQSTGVLAVPVGYTVAPASPPSGEETYRAEAVVNPETAAADSIDLVWSVPLILPAYSAAAAAEAARDRAEQYATQTQDIAVGSPQGDLWATSPVLPVANAGDNAVLSFGVNRWALSAAGAAAGFTAGGNVEEHLVVPRIAAPGAMGMFFEVTVGGVVTSNGILLFGFHRSNRADFPVLLKLYAGQTPGDDAQFVNIDWRDQTLQLYGGDSTLSANTVVRISAAVVRGEPGPGGSGQPGAALSDAEIKQKYEANANTNAFTDAALAKLVGISAGATVNSVASINALIQAALAAAVAGNTETRITVTYNNDGTIDFVVDDFATRAEFDALTARVTALEGGSPPATDLVYFGWKPTNVIGAADLDNTLARVNSDADFENAWPPNDVNAYMFVAVRQADGEPTELYRDPNPINQIGAFDRQAGTVDDAGGNAHIVIVSQSMFVISVNARPVRVDFG